MKTGGCSISGTLFSNDFNAKNAAITFVAIFLASQIQNRGSSKIFSLSYPKKQFYGISVVVFKPQYWGVKHL